MRNVSSLLLILAAFLNSALSAQSQFSLISLGHINDGGTASDLSILGDFVYLANEGDGLRIYNVSSPINPVNVFHTNNGVSAFDVVVSGGHAYVVGSDGLRIYDVTDPTNSFSVAQIAHGSSGAATIVVTNNFAYVGAFNGFQIFDVSNPVAPTFVSATPFTDLPSVSIDGNYAYLAVGSLGLKTYDISNPTNAVLLGQTNNASMAIWIAAAGGYAYVANGSDGLRVYDVTNPAKPLNVGHTNTGGFAYGIALTGKFACLAQGNGLRVYDVSDPAHPINVASASTKTAVYGLAVSGNYVYAAASSSGLLIYLLAPQLKISPAGTNTLAVSWPVPPAPFVLQECADLSTSNWTTLTNTPTVIGAQNQIILAQPTGSKFYRLTPK
jgi:hypothetical protein